MKQVIALAILIATGSAIAQEDPQPQPRPKNRNNIEEVTVTGIDLSNMQGALMVGLSGAYLIHEYDKDKDEWRFIRVSSKTKEG